MVTVTLRPKFLRWMCLTFIHREGKLDGSLDMFWTAHKKALAKAGFTCAEFEALAKEALDHETKT